MSAQIQRNISLLLYLWLSRTTGHVHLTGTDGLVLPMANGALLDCCDMRDLSSRLGSHRVSLVPGTVPGEGNRRRMGTYLQILSRRYDVDFTMAYAWERSDSAWNVGAWDLDAAVGGLGGLLAHVAMGGAANRDIDQERLLQRGIAAMNSGDWQAADAALSKARDLRMDDPLTLANLAWARVNNLSLPWPQRVSDARAYLRLASALAPEDTEVRALALAVMKIAPTLMLVACAA